MLVTSSETTPRRGNPSAKRGPAAALKMWTPQALILPALAAVRPLVDDRGEDREGVDHAQICKALDSLMGHFNVSDAVLASGLFKSAQAIASGLDSSILATVWFTLRAFICSAEGSSSACAVARSCYVSGERDGLSPDCRATLLDALQGDVLAFDSGVWHGWLFGGREANPDSDFVERPWWWHRAQLLRMDGIARH